MKTFLRFYVFDKGEISLKNLPFAFAVLLVALVVLAVVSYLIGWAISFRFSMQPENLFSLAFARIFVGLVALGMVEGIFTILGLFVLALKYSRSEKYTMKGLEMLAELEKWPAGTGEDLKNYNLSWVWKTKNGEPSHIRFDGVDYSKNEWQALRNDYE